MGMHKVVALGATVAVASGALILGSGAANAAGDPDFKKLSAPSSVTAGQLFRIKCKLDPKVNWNGAVAQLAQKRATINAKRDVSPGGNCSMRIVLSATGKQKIRVIVTQNGGALESSWLTIRVKPAS
ncbi:MAG: hypothetical protein MUF33_12840 [Candidatus Nanopelagicales bacterium]|nr:hypothetical protein [Candidatus Nanopelagicales bacterium]MCU0294851.1 hypothetical protein [Candidatus Nanopelagicales bacterium]MCU0299387.1 hypothetical protein [Candidatus Nanopelagicales bacterium]